MASERKSESSHVEVAQEDQVCEQTGVEREEVKMKVETGNSIFICVIWVLVILCMTVGVELFTTYRCLFSLFRITTVAMPILPV